MKARVSGWGFARGLRGLAVWLAWLALFALGGVHGCSTAPPRATPLTPLDQLPAGHAEAWLAFTGNLPSWPALRAQVRDDPELSRFFVNNLVRVLIRNYERSAIASAGQKAGAFERSRRELLYLRDTSGPVLVELVMVGDTIVSFLAGDLLQQMDEGRWSLAVARQLDNEDPEERRRAAEWLAKLPLAGAAEDEVFERLAGHVNDPDWSVRSQVCLALAARSLARGRIDLALPALTIALGDEDPSVVQVACEAMRRTGDRGAVPALLNALERLERGGDDPATTGSLQRTLLRLTGESKPRNSVAWRRWWRSNRP